MPWVKIDEHFTEHPKILSAGPLGLVLQVRALCYCNRNLTDGFIPHSQVKMWSADLEQLAMVLVHPQYTFASKQNGSDGGVDVGPFMVKFGLWDSVANGYQIHDYLLYQPSKQSLQRLTAIRKQVGRAGGIASGQAKRKQSHSKESAKSEAKLVAKSNPETETETLTTTAVVVVEDLPPEESSDLPGDSEIQELDPPEVETPEVDPPEAAAPAAKKPKNDECESCVTCLSVCEVFNDLLREYGLLGGRGHKPVGEGGRFLHARHGGYSVEECLIVVRKMVPEWRSGKWAKHLTLETLFRPGNFDKYLNRPVLQSEVDDLPEPGTPDFGRARL